MITVQILEPDDLIDGNDWCRPLQIISMGGGASDYYSFKSCYSGTPENNAEWVQVKHVIGSCWFGRPVRAFNDGLNYEFVRGDVPRKHRLNMRGYKSIFEFEKRTSKITEDD